MSNVAALLVAVGASWESTALGMLNARQGVVVLKRCVDVTDLLASAAAGQADVAVVALDAHGLDIHALDTLRRHQVRAIAVVPDADDEFTRGRAARLGIDTLVSEHDLRALPDAVLGVPAATDTPTAATPPTTPPAAMPPVTPTAPAATPGQAGPSDRVAPAPGMPNPPTHTSPRGGEPAAPGGQHVAPPPQVGVPTASPEAPAPGPDAPSAPAAAASGPGRIIVIWGPAGAPGRSTVAGALAADLASRGAATLAVDADPYGGALAQQWGVLDEVSGLLSAARLSMTGDLEDRFATVQRQVAPRLSLISGLPRADRWVEIRTGAIEHILEAGQAQANVVVDTGFSLEENPTGDFGGLPGRNSMTIGALSMADEIVVVGSADPVGLSRLARGLVELREITQGAPVRVVVNRMRSSLGWAESDVAGMVEGFTRTSSLHFLPEDRVAVDRALIAGRTLTESGDSALARAVAPLATAMIPGLAEPPSGRGRRIKRRTAGTDRRR